MLFSFQQMATLLLDHVKSSGTKIIQGESPSRLTRQSNGRILVEWESGSDVFDTVLLAVGESYLILHVVRVHLNRDNDVSLSKSYLWSCD